MVNMSFNPTVCSSGRASLTSCAIKDESRCYTLKKSRKESQALLRVTKKSQTLSMFVERYQKTTIGFCTYSNHRELGVRTKGDYGDSIVLC